VTAEHDHYAAAEPVRVHDGISNPPEVAGDKNVGQRVQKRAKASILPRGRSKFLGPNFVRPSFDGNCADLRQVRFWN